VRGACGDRSLVVFEPRFDQHAVDFIRGAHLGRQ
jgi:hypothetical protein